MLSIAPASCEQIQRSWVRFLLFASGGLRVHSPKIDSAHVAVVALYNDKVAEGVHVDGAHTGDFCQIRVRIKPLAVAYPEIVCAAPVQPSVDDPRRVHIPDAVARIVLADEVPAIGNETNGTGQDQPGLESWKAVASARLRAVAR